MSLFDTEDAFLTKNRLERRQRFKNEENPFRMLGGAMETWNAKNNPEVLRAKQIQSIVKDAPLTYEGMIGIAQKLNQAGFTKEAHEAVNRASQLKPKGQDKSQSWPLIPATKGKSRFKIPFNKNTREVQLPDGGVVPYSDAQGMGFNFADPEDKRSGQEVKSHTPRYAEYNGETVLVAPTSQGIPRVFSLNGKRLTDIDPKELKLHRGTLGTTSATEYGARFDENAGKTDIKTIKEVGDDIFQSGKQATTDLARYDVMESLLNEIETGLVTNWEVFGKKAANVLGADYNVAGEEAFRSMALSDMLNYVAQTKGSISEAENKMFMDASPGLTRSSKGNKLIVAFAKHGAKRKREEMIEFARWKSVTPRKKQTREKWQEHQIEWKNRQPSFLTKDKLKDFIGVEPKKVMTVDEIMGMDTSDAINYEFN